MNIFQFLTDHAIPYERHDHAAVFTCGAAEKDLRSDLAGAHTKNLFLRDKKGKRHFLVTVGYDKNVDLGSLKEQLNTTKLGFGSADRLKDHLGVEPGSVSLLGLVNDPDHRVEVVIDEAVWNADAVLCHPLINTATLVIPHHGLETFLQATGHEVQVMDVPSR